MAAELWLVAGPNGAGKTTCSKVEPFATIMPRVVSFNSDNVTLGKLHARGYRSFADAPFEVLLESFILAAEQTEEEIASSLQRGESVSVETVLSTAKYQSITEDLLARGGELYLIYVCLNRPELSCERIARRVAMGGHDVPRDKALARWHRSLKNLPWFLEHATHFWVFDNSDSHLDEPPLPIADGGSGRIVYHTEPTFAELRAAFDAVKWREVSRLNG